MTGNIYINRALLTGARVRDGLLHLADNTIFERCVFEDTLLRSEPEAQFIRIMQCDLIRCDLREMSWDQFHMCRIEVEVGRDDLLPRRGHIMEAVDCFVRTGGKL